MDSATIPPIRVFVSHRLHSGPGPFVLAQKRTPTADSNIASSIPAGSAQSGSELLKKIHRALHGSLTSSESTSYIHSTLYANIAPPWQSELELSWNRSSVVLSVGDVVQRQWNFANEGRPVQWACIGHLARPPKRRRSKVNVNEDPLMATDPTDEAAMSATFGPFHHHTSHQTTSHDTTKKTGVEPKEDEIVPAVFIFLRDVGRIYALDGTDYNFPLPFLTRRAWPLHPHGVLIQRMPEPGEFDVMPSEADEDYLLPTIFTLTNPWAEPSAVAVASGLVGSPARLKDETQYTSRRIPNISPKEIVLWTAPRVDGAGDDIALTYNEEEESINIWRYAYIRQNDAPKPLKKRRANAARRRSSMMNGFRSNNAAGTEASSDQEFDNFLSLAHGEPDSHDSDADESLPLSALPNRQPSLKATTMQAIGKKASDAITATPSSITARRGSPSLSNHRRGGSTTRNELSITMDRMALNAKAEADMMYSVEPGVMKPTFWFEKLDSLAFQDKR
jgi:anaphase-promoting complex subunit 1